MQKLLQIEVQKDRFVMHFDNSNLPSTFKKGFYLMCQKEKNPNCIWHNTWDVLTQHTHICT